MFSCFSSTLKPSCEAINFAFELKFTFSVTSPLVLTCSLKGHTFLREEPKHMKQSLSPYSVNVGIFDVYHSSVDDLQRSNFLRQILHKYSG